MDIAKAYHYLFNEMADPRVANFPLMRDPFPTLLILLAYFLFVLHIGPRYMKNRKPYKLTNVLIVYNVVLTIANGLVCYGLVTSGYTTRLSLGCEPLRISYDPEPLKMTSYVWWVYMLKIIELGDTIIFVLRKKYNQTSFLHVYHHSSTLLLSWIVCKYAPGDMWTFIMIPNCFVHVVMYAYYLLAALGPAIQEKIVPWKKHITRLQLIQFTVMLLHTSQSLLLSCDPSRKSLAFMYTTQEAIMFYMFWGFYKKAYLRKKVE